MQAAFEEALRTGAFRTSRGITDKFVVRRSIINVARCFPVASWAVDVLFVPRYNERRCCQDRVHGVPL